MTDLVCENCSTPLPGGSKFCNECGTPVPGQGAARQAPYTIPTDLRQALQIATAGEYEIHNELGRGGMGSVFLAREIGLDRLVAIKVLPPTLMFDEGLIVRFKREAKMVAKLHHPNIIPVYRVHHSHNLAFYTMHFVSGRSLSEIISSGRTLSLEEIEKSMLDVAAGLGYAHKRGVIHRDVKPANILLDADGHVHVTDFGIAKALVGHTQLTESGTVIGTPQYMAPEQCEGRVVDGRADQYSLACVGYHLLVGQPPFESDSMKELIYHHLFTPPKPLGIVRPDTPVSLRDAIHKALSKDPTDRFDCMEDLRTAIEGKGPPIFVKWIDGPGEERRGRGTRSRQRRATDLPPTQRLGEVSWSSGRWESESGSRMSVYQRAMAALAITVVSLGAVAVLAVSQGAGLAGSLKSPPKPSGSAENVASLTGAELGKPSEPAGSNGKDVAAPRNFGVVRLAREMPPGAMLEVDGERLDTPLRAGAEIRLQLGTRNIVITADGYRPWSQQVEVLPSGLELEPSLERDESPAGRPATSRVSRVPSAREPSAEMIGQLRQLLEQGKALYRAQRYAEALEYLRELSGRAEGARKIYGSSDSLTVLIEEAGEMMMKTRKECEVMKDPTCR